MSEVTPIRSETQLYKLQQLFAENPEVSKSVIVTTLGIKESSVPVYIHQLRKKYKAEIENILQARVVVGYRLKNMVAVPQFKRSTAFPKASKGLQEDVERTMSLEASLICKTKKRDSSNGEFAILDPDVSDIDDSRIVLDSLNGYATHSHGGFDFD